MNKEGMGYTIVFIFVVSFLFVFLLSLTNQITKDQVELNQELARQEAVLTALGVRAETADEIQAAYGQVRADDDAGLYAAQVDGQLVYAAQFSGAGLWGAIEGILAVSSDIGSIVGLEIVADNETPGLGGRINEDWFKDQFRGEVVGPDGIVITAIAGDGDESKTNGVVDGVTGATRTSDAMQVIINDEISRLRSAQIKQALQNLRGGNS